MMWRETHGRKNTMAGLKKKAGNNKVECLESSVDGVCGDKGEETARNFLYGRERVMILATPRISEEVSIVADQLATRDPSGFSRTGIHAISSNRSSTCQSHHRGKQSNRWIAKQTISSNKP